jgi:hypothetical protein
MCAMTSTKKLDGVFSDRPTGAPPFQTGLPDGFSSDQKSQFGYILEDLEMENVVVPICSGHLEYFTTLGHILWAFGNLVVIWYISPRFGILYQLKSGNSDFKTKNNSTVALLVPGVKTMTLTLGIFA